MTDRTRRWDWNRPLGQIVMAVGLLVWTAFLIGALIGLFIVLNIWIFHIPFGDGW